MEKYLTKPAYDCTWQLGVCYAAAGFVAAGIYAQTVTVHQCELRRNKYEKRLQ